MNLQPIFDDCCLTVNNYETVHGGDINQCFCLQTPGDKYFLKVNDAELYPGMFEKEAHGLQALGNNCTLIIPAVIKFGVIGTQQYLLLEWLNTGNQQSTTWESFGVSLADLHKKKQFQFGWNENNYIGSLSQCNTFYNNWHEFYTENRIMPLVRQLYNNGKFTKTDLQGAEILCKNLEQLFPAEPPALLHGDLWSGNYLISDRGKIALFDPAVYCGHREMDIGMSRLFGGFASEFYQSYQEVYPLEPAWEQRLPLTQLYPLLVHAVLFDRSYVLCCREILIVYTV